MISRLNSSECAARSTFTLTPREDGGSVREQVARAINPTKVTVKWLHLIHLLTVIGFPSSSR
jgi:hypothetical protein